MARTAKQIRQELALNDKPAESLLRKQIGQTRQRFQGEKKGLLAQKDRAFGDILSGAKGRGLKFSGIPLEEQAEFTATEFLPALARLSGQRQDRVGELQGSLADIVRQRGLSAQGLRQQELDRDLAERNAARAAAAARAQFDASNVASGFKDRIAQLLEQINALKGGGQGFGQGGAPVAQGFIGAPSSSRVPLFNGQVITPQARQAAELAGRTLSPTGFQTTRTDKKGRKTVTRTPAF